MRAESQHDAILNHLRKGFTITPLDALSEFGCMRLASRIHEIRQEGVKVNDKVITSGNARFKAYWI